MVLNQVSPNAVRRQCNETPDQQPEECDPSRSADGTFSIRRRFTNMTGADVNTLRFRVVDITTLNSPGYTPGGAQAGLRAISSAQVMATTSGGTVTVEGTTLEAPSSATLGGGSNSTLAAGTVMMSDPLVPMESINLQFFLGVQQGGFYRFFVNVEALPNPGGPPFAPAHSKSGAQQPKVGGNKDGTSRPRK